MYENWKILKSEINEKIEEYTQVAEWCNENGQYLIEDDGEFYKVVRIPEPLPPTEEEQRENRAKAYQQEVDPITSHIQRLRDEEQTEEVIAEINELINERALKVEEIKQRYPYPIDKEKNQEYNDAELTL